MSSFNMHIAISKELKEKFSLGNDFMLGTVLPDLYKILLKDRNLTHFQNKIGEEYLPDIEKFCNDYKDKKSEIVYGYLAHLIQDKIWFHQYLNKKYVKELENGKYYKYFKDSTIHDEEEYIKNIYTDYSIMDKYIIEKYSLNIKKINNNLKNCVLKSKTIAEKEELINLIDTKIIDYSLIYDIKTPITFITKEDIDEYYKITLEETEKILKQF